MRRRRSNALRFSVVAALAISAVRGAGAQTGGAVGLEGGPEFLLPIGARGIGAAQAIVARGVGAEAIWVNPALIARGPREVAFTFGQANGAAEADVSAAILWPVKHVGAFELTVRYLNEGQQASVNGNQEVVGSFAYAQAIVAGTFAAPFGPRFAGGVTLKLLQLATPCTGSCDLPEFPPRTGAIDFGVQYFVTKDSLISIGAAGLNFGLPLQVNDSPQADHLPSRIDMGVAVSPRFSQLPSDIHVVAEADILKRPSNGGPGYRFGAEMSWQDLYVARVGYQLNGPTGSGLTFGFGATRGKVHIDFAQMLTDTGLGTGKPTFLSLRYLF
jgi:hypothetical protein